MARKRTARSDELSTRTKTRKRLLEIRTEVEQGFIDHGERTDDQLDYWDIYNSKLGENQYYNGNSKIFVPIVHDAVEARKTRFAGQIFPQSGRYIEVTTENGDIPHAEMALLEHYVRRAGLRTTVVPALLRNGDIEGQYNVYVSWQSRRRHVVWAEDKPITIGGVEMPDVEQIEEIHEDVDIDEGPHVEVLPDADVLVLPATADTIEEALACGGSVTVIRRWSKAKLQQMIDDEDIAEDPGEHAIKAMTKPDAKRFDSKKSHVDAAGIKEKGKFYLGYETWTMLKVDGEMRLCRIYFGSGDEPILSAKLNPYWCDRCPVISHPVDKISGAFKGISKVEPCAQIQYYANDILNEAADSATYSMLPIIMTDPAKNPRVGSMILDLAAVWETNPNDTKFAQFPQLWQHGFEIVNAAKQQVFQTLGVNPSMMPQQTGTPGRKRNQAEIANEQMVDIMTTADAVTVLEQGILTPVVERFAEYDAQFRNEEVTIKQFGQMGLRARMEKVPPFQLGRRYAFRWFGVEAARNAQQIQQQIAGMNVLRGIPPQLYPGRQLDLTPIIEQLVENTFGPRLAPLVFKDLRDQLAMDPEQENGLLEDGFDLQVHPLDNDAEHMKVHQQALRAGDPHGTVRAHMLRHQHSMAIKAHAVQPHPMGQPGTPGGGPPGIAGLPRAGAQPAQPRQNKGPPGLIRPDNMPAAGAVPMPRRM